MNCDSMSHLPVIRFNLEVSLVRFVIKVPVFPFIFVCIGTKVVLTSADKDRYSTSLGTGPLVTMGLCVRSGGFLGTVMLKDVELLFDWVSVAVSRCECARRSRRFWFVEVSELNGHSNPTDPESGMYEYICRGVHGAMIS